MVRRIRSALWPAAVAALACLVAWGCEGRRSGVAPAGDSLSQSSRDQSPQGSLELKAIPYVQRHCSLIALNPDKEQEFRRLHKEMPREVKKVIQEHGIRNYTVFVCTTNEEFYAVRYYEYVGAEHAGDMAALERDPDFKKWRNACEECEVTLLPLRSAKWWAPGEEVVHLD